MRGTLDHEESRRRRCSVSTNSEEQGEQEPESRGVSDGKRRDSHTGQHLPDHECLAVSPVAVREAAPDRRRYTPQPNRGDRQPHLYGGPLLTDS
jgi:hypothetical protein